MLLDEYALRRFRKEVCLIVGSFKKEAIREFLRAILGDAYQFKYELLQKMLDGPDKDKCWHWMGMRDVKGYGQIEVGGYFFKTHRLSEELFHGPITPGFHVMHSCDNPPCWNPNHLSQGTPRMNMQDKIMKGRHKKIEIQTVVSRITRKAKEPHGRP